MIARRTGVLIANLALLGFAAGCTQPNAFTSRQTSIGTLKASVSQLHSEKDELERQVADLESENRRVENRLARSEQENGSLMARLEDTRRTVAGQGGGGFGGGSGQGEAIGSNDPSAMPAKSSTTRKTNSGRRVPFAEIPGRISPANPADEPDQEDSGRPASDDLGPQSSRSNQGWRAGASVARTAWQSPNVVR